MSKIKRQQWHGRHQKNEKFEPRNDLRTEINFLIRDSHVETEFSQKATEMAKQFRDNPSPKEQKNRTNLKSLPLCTIDGETAKDFDDAVYAKKNGRNFEVLVAIADVAHYVTERSPIDIDAIKRATSIYYPGHCIPMIPEALSNGLCSLKPKVPRLCMTAEFIVTPAGLVKDVRVGQAVMKSQARLTYTGVQKLIDSSFKKIDKIPVPVVESIKVLQKAALALRKARAKRGSIDFDAVEAVVALNKKGEPISIAPSERLEAHRLIEDLMIAANEAVAGYLEEKGIATIFRIHEPPNSEKLKAFSELAQSLGALTPEGQRALMKAGESPAALAGLIASFKEHPAKASLDSALLRSMMQARYSSKNAGHYGLASKSYLHFTSPIRRYPDLMVHRVLKEHWAKQKSKRDLEEVAMHCSSQERKATDLERQIHALHACWFMKDKIGEQHRGVITTKTDFGFFVRLNLHHIEGLVHISNIPTQRWATVKVGDKVLVEVANVNLVRRLIDFKLL
ncbi:MAG: VacB/RNase II family 3'-5' exoribonuclease [Myxococcota bacterium]